MKAHGGRCRETITKTKGQRHSRSNCNASVCMLECAWELSIHTGVKREEEEEEVVEEEEEEEKGEEARKEEEEEKGEEEEE
ncbi:hypothetical protein ElyMa_006342000 [Elysia marginata]|uniref:Uncharacterized protein n=1 Tax=Elysia marginata TaxID=1093978 RepID=A0AAV4HIY5_9GAST|nr:hypothetical protein ElyMa_006342000 [Elysia marginata]